MEEQLESSCEEVHFSREEVVWAKITGYPWWPALVTHAPSEGGAFRVDFFADNTQYRLSHSAPSCLAASWRSTSRYAGRSTCISI